VANRGNGASRAAAGAVAERAANGRAVAEVVRLTEYARCAGCASKMGPGDLARALAPLPVVEDPRLLVGRETFDDAAVIRITDDIALVQTVDFFAPIVDDPYTFGRVAAANALSDVYAMGGEPLTALNIVAFPADRLPMSVLSDMLRGGHDTVHEAGALIVGGHSVIDEELKYGLAVTGRVHPGRILTNAAAKPGDRLVLTKPLGNGLVATALKQGKLAGDAAARASDEMLRYMLRPNRDASQAAVALGVRCATDVTGFGLAGHGSHIARASGVTLRVSVDSIPVLPAARLAFSRGAKTAGGARNRAFVDSMMSWGRTSDFSRALVTDPQTSGGLLVAVPPAAVREYLSRVEGSAEIGVIEPAGAHGLVLE
jgi:selenide,water dikinase